MRLCVYVCACVWVCACVCVCVCQRMRVFTCVREWESVLPSSMRLWSACPLVCLLCVCVCVHVCVCACVCVCVLPPSMPTHRGDRTLNIWISRFYGVIVNSFEWRGLCLLCVRPFLKSRGLPRKRVWNVRGLLWKLVGNFGSHKYFKHDLLRLWRVWCACLL